MIVKVLILRIWIHVSQEKPLAFYMLPSFPTEQCVNQMGRDSYCLGQHAKEMLWFETWDCEDDIQKAESDYV